MTGSAIRRIAPFLVLVAALPAAAQDKPDCTTATGMGTHACTFPDGQVVVETNLCDRTVDHAGGLDSTSLSVADTLVHIGIDHGLEAQIGWTAFDAERTTVRRTGTTTRSGTPGDLSLGGKLALVSGDGGPLSVAVQPAVTIATGNRRIGRSGVGGELLLPIGYDLGGGVSLDVSPDIELTGNRAGQGRHVQYGTTIGIDGTIGPRLTTTVEYGLFRDEDPAFVRTRQVLTTSFGWMATPLLQLSAGFGAGLTARSPRSEWVVGFARHFR